MAASQPAETQPAAADKAAGAWQGRWRLTSELSVEALPSAEALPDLGQSSRAGTSADSSSDGSSGEEPIHPVLESTARRLFSTGSAPDAACSSVAPAPPPASGQHPSKPYAMVHGGIHTPTGKEIWVPSWWLDLGAMPHIADEQVG